MAKVNKQLIVSPVVIERQITPFEVDTFERFMEGFWVERYSTMFKDNLRYYDVKAAMKGFGAMGATEGVIFFKYKEFFRLFDALTDRRERKAYGQRMRDLELEKLASEKTVENEEFI